MLLLDLHNHRFLVWEFSTSSRQLLRLPYGPAIFSLQFSHRSLSASSTGYQRVLLDHTDPLGMVRQFLRPLHHLQIERYKFVYRKNFKSIEITKGHKICDVEQKKTGVL